MLTRIRESNVYREFQSFSRISQLIVIAKAVGGGMTAFAFVNGILPFLYVSIPLAVVSTIIACKAAMKEENKKQVRLARRQFYVESIKKMQEMFDEAEAESQNLVLAAEAKLEKQNQTAELKAEKKKQNNDFLAIENDIRRANKGLSESFLLQKINAARRKFFKEKFAALGRQNAQRFEQGLSQLNDIITELEAIESGEANKDNSMRNVHGAADEKLQNPNSFAARFGLLVDTIAGGMKAFVGAASTIYVILSYAIGAIYTSPAVLVPTLFVGLIASVFGLKVGYNDHQADLEETKEFNDFDVQMNNITNKHRQIIELNKKIRKIFHLEQEEKEDKEAPRPMLSPKVNNADDHDIVITLSEAKVPETQRPSWLSRTKTTMVSLLPGAVKPTVVETLPEQPSSLSSEMELTTIKPSMPSPQLSTAATIKKLNTTTVVDQSNLSADVRQRAFTVSSDRTSISNSPSTSKSPERRGSEFTSLNKTKTQLSGGKRLQPLGRTTTYRVDQPAKTKIDKRRLLQQ